MARSPNDKKERASTSDVPASVKGTQGGDGQRVEALSTQLIHHPYEPPAGFAAPPLAVHKAATVFFPNTAAMRARQWVDRSSYTYGLHGTPTTFHLEQRLATLEGAKYVSLAPSGLAAVTLVSMACLKAGDHVVLPDNVYGPNLVFTKNELATWGITHSLYDALDAASLQAALKPNTQLVWTEAPGSVTMEFPDLRSLVATVRQHAPQATIALDNTWGAGIAFAPFDLGQGVGVDVTVHALTKYPSGGGDVLMGSVACRDQALAERITLTHSRLGLGVGANDVETLLRGLPTIALRYAAQDAAGRRVAQWLTTRPEIERVLHPALPGSPGHAHWLTHATAAAGLLSMVFKDHYTPAQVDGFVDALKRFHIGYSWGGPFSLAVPYNVRAMRGLTAPYSGIVVRLSIGFEDVDDLLADLAQGFNALA
jgi:cysteine-S-conjugate beta-lyase